jgi:predicted dithiol-disulfide oxidoreductase (DUF899 family)
MISEQKYGIPRVVSQQEWLEERLKLWKKEKDATKLLDRLRAERKRLPMVKLEKEYVFESPKGKHSLIDLFEGRKQLIVHHFMYFEEPDRFCPGCSLDADQNYNGPFFKELHNRSVTLVATCRAKVERIEKEKLKKNWNFPFYSITDPEFNYDFQASLAPGKNSIFNYQEAAKMSGMDGYVGDTPSKSVFLQHQGEVFHCYSAYARGLELSCTHYNYLDLTPYGRQEAWEDSPENWPKSPIGI